MGMRDRLGAVGTGYREGYLVILRHRVVSRDVPIPWRPAYA